MDGLTQFPDLGQRKDDISPGLRARPVGQHMISYRVTDEVIRVLRVLHVRMDAEHQFAS
jgi:toxin ParE1/3/4